MIMQYPMALVFQSVRRHTNAYPLFDRNLDEYPFKSRTGRTILFLLTLHGQHEETHHGNRQVATMT